MPDWLKDLIDDGEVFHSAAFDTSFAREMIRNFRFLRFIRAEAQMRFQ